MNQYNNTAEYYDLLYKIEEIELSFYKKFINPFRRILEMGCGTGRLTIDLALKSHWKSYECLDISGPMLSILRNKLAEKINVYPFYKKIKIYQTDMRTFNSDEKYDLIIYSFQSIQCMSRSDIKDQIKISCNLLAKNGILVISTFDPKIGYIENAEHLNTSGIGKNNELLMLVDREIKYNNETFSYKQDLKIYNEYLYHTKTITDEFCIGNIDFDFIMNIHHDTELKLIGFYSDYSKKLATKEDKFYINVYKKFV